MNLPAFPTDNLYKFIAIAGLILSGYCAFFAYQQVWEIKFQIIGLETDERIIKTEITELTKELDNLSERMAAENTIALQEVKDFQKRHLAIAHQKTRFEGKRRENELLIEQLNNHFKVFWVGIVGGLLVSIVGFWLWYKRIQKPAETLMAKRIAEWEKDKANLPN